MQIKTAASRHHTRLQCDQGTFPLVLGGMASRCWMSTRVQGRVLSREGDIMTKTIAATLFAWAGLLLGVSFVATPAKFLAPSLAMAQALDVGRWTFHVLAWIEWGILVALAFMIAIRWFGTSGLDRVVAGLVVMVAIVLAAESFLLRPVLDARVLRIMAGETVPASQWHNIYIALEALRLALIGAAGVRAIRHPV
jgi:hypothetical protein